MYSRVQAKILVVLVWFLVLPALLIPVASSAIGASQRSSTALLTEWTVPTPQSGPSALSLDEKGRCCWFLEYYGNKIGHFDENTGTIQEWTLPVANANPYDLAVSSVSGSVVLWGTEIGLDRVFAFWPNTGAVREYSLPHGETGVGYISVEPSSSAEVRVWFTETTGNRNGELIYDPSTFNVTLYEDSFPAAVGGGAFGVYATPSSVWFAGFSAIVRWDRTSQQYTMYPLPIHGLAVGRSIALDSYGNAWYTQASGNGTSENNYVGVIRGNSVIENWQVPTLGADLGSISINPVTQQPWLIEQSRQLGNGIVAVLANSTGAQLVPTSVTTAPSAGGPIILGTKLESMAPSTSIVPPLTTTLLGPWNGPFSEYLLGAGSQPRDVVADSAGNVWVSEPGSNKIARISGPSIDFAVGAATSLLSLNRGGSATVTVNGVSISDFAGPLALTVTAVPLGVSVSDFNPRLLVIPAGGNATATVMIKVSASASNGTSLILIHASNGTLDHTTSLIITISAGAASSTAQCLITTATFGSQLASSVQLARNFRDNDVQATRVGASFMIAFNSWYYSFSPFVANYIAHNSLARSGVRLLLYPLVGVVYLAIVVYNSIPSFPEFAVLVAGLFASSMIGILYVGLPLGIINRRLHLIRKRNGKVHTSLLIAGLCGVSAGLATSSSQLLMISTSLSALACMSWTAILTANWISGDKDTAGQIQVPILLMLSAKSIRTLSNFQRFVRSVRIGKRM
ncbi:MAG: CFI-box-CTERM domain-containing protein [Candidatus Bathyarchaeia archaeon]